MIRKYLISLAMLVLGFCLFSAAPVQAGTKHTIKASARPYKAIGHAVKATVHGAAKATATTVQAAAGFSIAAFDAAVIDPFGVALQTFADGVDMFIAVPLEALPHPLNEAGVAIHYVYLGVDKVGEVLAR